MNYRKDVVRFLIEERWPRLKRTMALRLLWLILIAGLGIGYVLMVRQPARPADSEATQDRRVQEVTAAVETLASEYDAIVDWEDRVPKRGWLMPPFTLAVKRAVLDGTGRPVIARLYLLDVDEDASGVMAVFGPLPLLSVGPSTYFVLRCSDSQASALMSIPDQLGFNEFVIVAQPEAVTKPLFVLRAGMIRDEETWIEVDGNAPPIITGVLLDFVSVGAPF